MIIFYLCLLALCGNGAKKLLENGEALIEMMLQCMEHSQPYSVRREGFRLAQCLAVMAVISSSQKISW